MFEPLVAASITGAVRVLTGVRARWLGCGPAATQRIYDSNHTSHVDFVLLWSALPPQLRARTRPVAAGDYWTKGAVRRYVIHQVFRGVLVDRGPVAMGVNPVAPMLDALDHGDSLILFPEGTRGDGKELLPFKHGIFHVARALPSVELVPVWIDNSYRVMPKGVVLPLPLLCSVTFGQPTRIEAEEDHSRFLTRLRQSLLELGSE
jgi:1-acyl-sn-glycerol-3-phosphate acyltransferase